MKKIIHIFLGLFLFSASAFGQNTFTSQNSGDWSSGVSGGVWDCGGCGENVPNSDDIVIISGTHDIRVFNAPQAAFSITLNAGTSRNQTFLDLYDNLTVSGDITVNDHSDVGLFGAILSIGGQFAQNAVTGTLSPDVEGTNTVIYNGANIQNIYPANESSGQAIPYENLTLSNTSGGTLTGNTVVTSTINLASGALSIGSNSLELRGLITGTGTLSGSASSNLIITGSTASFGTISFTSGAQQLNNFTLNKSAGTVATLGSNLTVNGTLALTSGTLDLNGNTLTASGAVTRTSGIITGGTTSGFVVSGSGSLPTSFDINGTGINLTMNRASTTFTIADATTLNNLTNSAGTFDKGALDLTILGDLTNNGTFTSTGGTTTFNGSTAQTITGSSSVTFNNLTLSNANGITLGTDVTVLGAYSQTAGTVTGDVSTMLTFDGTGTISGLDVSGLGLTLNRPETISLAGFSIGSLIISQGTVNIGTGVLNLAGDLDISSTLNAADGTIRFNGSSLQTISGTVSTIIEDIIIANDVTNNHTAIDIENSITFEGTNNDLDADGSGSGIITLLSTSHIGGTAFIGPTTDGNTVSGEITMQRFMDAENPPAGQGGVYRYLASPVEGAVVADWNSSSFPITGGFTGSSPINTAPSMFYYDESVGGNLSEGWIEYPTTTDQASLVNGVGYTVYQYNSAAGSDIISSRGTVINSSVTFNPTYTNDPGTDGISGTANEDANYGWNLLGNPFPSAINWDNVTLSGLDDDTWTGGGVTAEVAVRDDAASGFLYYSQSLNSGTFDGIIASHQAFWVHVESPDGSGNPTTTGTVIISQSAKTSANATFYRKKELDKELLRVYMSNGEVQDQTLLVFTSVGSKEYQPQYDAMKLPNDIINFSSISTDNKILAIDALPKVTCIDSVTLNVSKNNPTGNYSLSFAGWDTFINDKKIALFDSYTGKTVNVTQESNYSFEITSEETSTGNRFIIIVDERNLSEPQIIQSNNNTLETPYTGDVQWFLNGEAIPGATESSLTIDTSGLYALEIYNEAGCSTRTEMEVVVTRIDDILDGEQVKLYPNPVTSDYLYIDVGSLSNAIAQVRNNRGQVVFVQKLHDGLNKLNISKLESGLYFVTIRHRNNTITLKILKQ